MAAQLAAQADSVAALDPGTCAARDAAARFRAEVIASVARVPARYREPLMSAANLLAERLAACAEPTAKPADRQQKPNGHGYEKKKHEKKKHGKKR